jgi:hypothetical protein
MRHYTSGKLVLSLRGKDVGRPQIGLILAFMLPFRIQKRRTAKMDVSVA